jgi:hypothetical protein
MDALVSRLLAAASLLVPRARREDWRREWTAEVAGRRAELEARGMLDAVARADLLLRALGALPDALAVRRVAAETEAGAVDGVFAASPARALTAVAVLALAGVMEAVAVVAFGAFDFAGGPFPLVFVLFYAFSVLGLAYAATRAAALLLHEPPPAGFALRPRLSSAVPVRGREREARAVALAAGAAGFAVTALLVLRPPTPGMIGMLADGRGGALLEAHVFASAALGFLLHETLRGRASPAG